MAKKRRDKAPAGQRVKDRSTPPRDQETLARLINDLIGRILNASIFEESASSSIPQMLEELARLRIERVIPQLPPESPLNALAAQLWPIPKHPTEDWFSTAYTFFEHLRNASSEDTKQKIVLLNIADEGHNSVDQLRSMVEYRVAVEEARADAASLLMFNAMRRLIAFEVLVEEAHHRLSGSTGGRPSDREKLYAIYRDVKARYPNAREKELAAQVVKLTYGRVSESRAARIIREMKRQEKQRRREAFLHPG